MSKKEDQGVQSVAPVIAEGDEPIAKVSINKYDPFQLKGSIDDEICYVSFYRGFLIFTLVNRNL